MIVFNTSWREKSFCPLKRGSASLVENCAMIQKVTMFNISRKSKTSLNRKELSPSGRYLEGAKVDNVCLSMPEPGPQDKILVVVAHPDDEWLACSGFLQRAVKNGAKTKVVIVTLGEWSQAYSYLDNGRMKSFFASLGKKRAKETLAAMKKIGLSADSRPASLGPPYGGASLSTGRAGGKTEDVVFLGYPGGHLQTLFKKNWTEAFYVNYLKSDKVVFDFALEPGAPFSGEKLYESIKKIIVEFKPNAMITHSPLDTNKDHETVYWLVKDSLEWFNDAHHKKLKLKSETFFFLVHNRGYSFSGKDALNQRLSPPRRFLSREFIWHSFELNKDELKIKKTSMLKYKTQLKNPYLNVLLNSFCRQNELFYQEK